RTEEQLRAGASWDDRLVIGEAALGRWHEAGRAVDAGEPFYWGAVAARPRPVAAAGGAGGPAPGPDSPATGSCPAEGRSGSTSSPVRSAGVASACGPGSDPRSASPPSAPLHWAPFSHD